MADLPLGSLAFFPVRYPRFARAAGLGALGTCGRIRTGDSGFDSREISFGRASFGQARPGASGHGATDVFAGIGTRVVAAKTGRVPRSWTITRDGRQLSLPGVGFMAPHGRDIRGGNYIVLVDTEGLHHYYAHMAHPVNVPSNGVVIAGTELGGVGATGLPAGRVQHLHYQVTNRQGRVENINPYNELRRLAFLLGATANAGGHVTLPLLPPPPA